MNGHFVMLVHATVKEKTFDYFEYCPVKIGNNIIRELKPSAIHYRGAEYHLEVIGLYHFKTKTDAIEFVDRNNKGAHGLTAFLKEINAEC